MKHSFLALTALVLLASQSAHASRARLLALGEDKEDGSFYFEDYRNIFHNPAHANEFRDFMIVEYGGNGNAFGLDSETSPKAQGGFLKSSGNFVYGVNLGNESDVSASLRVLAGGTTLPKADNVLDLFFGGDHGVKWGTNVVYSKSENKQTGARTEDESIAVRLGAMADVWEAYANVSLANDSEARDATGAPKFDGKLGFFVGGNYKINERTTVFANAKKYDWDQTLASVKSEGGFTSYRVGLGRVHEVSATQKLYARTEYYVVDIEVKNLASTNVELSNRTVPVVLGYEVDANSWLALRGSISHNLYGTAKGKNLTSLNASSQTLVGGYGFTGALPGADEKEFTLPNSTVVSAGASLTFGNLVVDGLIGSTGASRATGTVGQKQGVLALDNMLSRVAMSYKF